MALNLKANREVRPGQVRARFFVKALAIPFCVLCLLGGTGKQSESPAAASGEELFAAPRVHEIQITLSEEELKSLRSNPRTYVSAAVEVNRIRHEHVGVHLKGSVGSFRPIDDKPSLTLNFAKFGDSKNSSDLTKIHLNNSAEDPSFMNEFIGGELFRSAGMPVPHVSYARVRLNGRDLGLYVLKEGFTEKFLGRYFERTDGNLYDTDRGHDVDQEMKNHAKPAEGTDRRELAQAAEAARVIDPSVRWKALNDSVDVERFLTFMAMEVILGHRDGYSMAKNNFRIYHDPVSNKVVFLPAGMDQLFGKADLPWHPQMAGILARAVVTTPEGEKAYKARFVECLDHFQEAPLRDRIDEVLNTLKEAVSGREFHSIEAEAQLVKRQIAARISSLREQLREADAGPLQFASGVARLQNWTATDVPRNGRMDRQGLADGVAALHIQAGPETFASWRTEAILASGGYTLRARVLARGIQPLPFGKSSGPGLRISGASRSLPVSYKPDEWTELEFPFEVKSEKQKVEFIAELRASAGEAWFDLATMEVIKNP